LPARRDDDKKTVVHVVSYDVARGAERYARALMDALNTRGSYRHVLLTLFRAEDDDLDPDISLEVPRGLMRRIGLDPRAIWRLRGALGRLQPAALVAHGGEPAKYASLADGGIPFAYLVIGSNHPRLASPIRRALRSFYIGKAAALVTVSDGLARDVRAEIGDDDRLRVIPNGRDPQIYRPAGRGALEGPRLIFIGHLEDQKRPFLFLDLIDEISVRGLAVSAVMVGGGPLLAEVRARAETVGVEVLGPRDDVAALLAESDLLVLTSRPPEGMPGVLIEAGLCGLPVVTTDVPGAREVVEDAVTGLVVGVDDLGGLSDAVESLLRDEGLRASMGAAARKRCAAAFSLDASADRWDTLLREIAK
jgi:glycosyltransferase involved in cell wall biosynthesis